MGNILNSMNKLVVRAYIDTDSEPVIELMTALQNYFVSIDSIGVKKPFASEDNAKNYMKQAIQDVEDMDGALFVAEQNKRIIGFIQGVIKNHDNDIMHKLTHKKSVDGWIGLLIVDSNHRSKGVGTALFNEMKKYFKQKNCTSIRLFVTGNNKKAIEIYNKYGFVQEDLKMVFKF